MNNELLQQEANLSQSLNTLRVLSYKTIGESQYGFQMIDRAMLHIRRQHEAVSIQLSEYFSEVA